MSCTMRTFQSRKVGSVQSRRSSFIAGRPAGSTGRAPTSCSSGPASLQTASSLLINQNQTSLEEFYLGAPDAVTHLAPFAPRPYNDAGVEFDVLGIGQAAVDFAASVEDSMLAALSVSKGGRRVISVEERAEVLELLQGYNSQVSAGGSLANTLVGLSQLAAAQDRSTCTHSISAANTISRSSTRQVKVAITGCVVGNDVLGEFAQSQLETAGVEVVPTQPPSSSATGVVMVFTTPDAQRSFLSSFSNEDRIVLTDELKSTVARARLVVIEGYMWEVQGAAEVLPEIIRHARSCGTLVALTAGDASVIERHAGTVLGAIETGVDLWLGNEAEAAALVQHIRQQQQQKLLQVDSSDNAAQPLTSQSLWADTSGRSSSGDLNNQLHYTNHDHHDSTLSHGQECALELSSICPMVVVTDGSRGSYITASGQLVVVPPYWSPLPPVDTCGAGDAYAAGLLHGFLSGLDLHGMGHVAAKTASAVISKHGPQLLPDDADWVAAGSGKQLGGVGSPAVRNAVEASQS